MLEVSQVIHALQEIAILEDDYANINGVVVIIDVSKATTAHFFQVTPSQIKKTTSYSEEALPMRQKASHFLNMPPGFEPLFNVFKPMLSQKQQERVLNVILSVILFTPISTSNFTFFFSYLSTAEI